jgi:hypothetical protein
VVAHQPQGVVLLLDQPPHAVERLLILQPPVQQLPAELVPAVGAQVALGVQLAEQPPGRFTLDGDLERGGAGRTGQPERLDLLHHEAELVGQGPPDCLAAGTGDIEVGAAAPPVDNREHLVGGEPAEGQQREGDPDAHRDQDVAGGVDPQRDAGHGDQGEQRRHQPLAGAAPAALGHQRVQHPHEDRREKGDLQ